MKAVPWLLVVFWLLTAAVSAQYGAIQPVATVRELHDAMIKPASDAIFNVGLEAPKNAEEWAAVRSAAVTLAESGNLLMLGSRAKDRGKWITLSRQLVDAGGTALRAANARNVSKLMQASDRIVIVCETCHARYLNQGPNMPSRRSGLNCAPEKQLLLLLVFIDLYREAVEVDDGLGFVRYGSHYEYFHEPFFVGFSSA